MRLKLSTFLRSRPDQIDDGGRVPSQPDSARLPGTTFRHVSDTIRTRRTNLHVDPDRPVPDELVDALCELVTWAPCHKRTWPWRFAVFSGRSRALLGEVTADALSQRGEPAARVDKTRTKYLRAPTVLVIGALREDDELRTTENRDAVAAGVQNLLLGATAAGLASFWSSCPSGAGPTVAEAAGFEASVSIVAVVYLGWPVRSCQPPERPEPEIVRQD